MDTGVQQSEDFVRSVACGDYEFNLFRRPNGNPSGQILARNKGGKRVPYEDLPPEAQEEFLKQAGKKSAKELLWK